MTEVPIFNHSSYIEWGIMRYIFVVVVQTNTGNVQGFIEESSFPGKNIQKFLNIPYAEPPLGNLRFERPKEIKKPCDGKI